MPDSVFHGSSQRLLWEHAVDDEVVSVNVSADSKCIVAQSYNYRSRDPRIRLYLFSKSGKCLWATSPIEGYFGAIAVSGSGEYVLTANVGGQLSRVSREGNVPSADVTIGRNPHYIGVDLEGYTKMISHQDRKVYCHKGDALAWQWESPVEITNVDVAANGEYIVLQTSEKMREPSTVYERGGTRLEFKGPIIAPKGVKAEFMGFGGEKTRRYQITCLNARGLFLSGFETREFLNEVGISCDGTYVWGRPSAVRGSRELCCFSDKGKELWKEAMSGGNMRATTSYDGRLLLVGFSDIEVLDRGTYARGSEDGMLYLFDRSGNFRWRHRMGSSAGAVSISPDGEYCVVGSKGRISVFQVSR